MNNLTLKNNYFVEFVTIFLARKKKNPGYVNSLLVFRNGQHRKKAADSQAEILGLFKGFGGPYLSSFKILNGLKVILWAFILYFDMYLFNKFVRKVGSTLQLSLTSRSHSTKFKVWTMTMLLE